MPLIYNRHNKSKSSPRPSGNGKLPQPTAPFTDFGQEDDEIKIALDEYDREARNIEAAVGPRPPLPSDLPPTHWSKQATQVLKERYLDRDLDGNITETPDQMCWRVAWEMARVEIKWAKTKAEILALAKDYYHLLGTHQFLPNSPTLMNAGKANHQQFSACFVLPVADSLSGIFDAIKYQALIHQSGGGTGFSFSRLRPQGAVVRSTRGVASGPISFMKVFDAATQQIKQGGSRRGANMGILRVDHPDIHDFIHCKLDGGITNFNISVAITDTFINALEKGEDYDLINPQTGETEGKANARQIMDEICQAAWKTGDPGLIFIDRVNRGPANPVPSLGPIESTNPCGEQPLYPFDACNLGTIFLSYFVKTEADKPTLDWNQLRYVVHLGVRFLDDVIEANPFPIPQVRQTVHQLRRIGLGVGGWADLLVKLGIPYDSQEALDLAGHVMQFVNEEGHKASQKLAQHRGSFPLWKNSIYADKSPIRNATVTTIAPTGTISIIAGTSSGVEPLFALSYQHIVKTENRTLTFLNQDFEITAKAGGFATDEVLSYVKEHGTVRGFGRVPPEVQAVFATAHEIAPEWHVKMQAAFQKYTDNAVSKTINLSHAVTVEDVRQAYTLAWQTGCMGITVFRDGCKGDQVLNLGVNSSEKPNGITTKPLLQTTTDEATSTLKPRPLRVTGATYRIKTPMGTAFITVNQDEVGNPLEVFINIGKAGSEVAAMAEALGRMISATFRFGNHSSPLKRAQEIVNQLAGIGGSRSVGFGPNKVRSLPDAVAKAISWHFGLLDHPEMSEKTSLDNSTISPEVTPPGQLNLTDPAGMASLRAPDPKLAAPADLCPACHTTSLVYQEGCTKCLSCGYSEC